MSVDLKIVPRNPQTPAESKLPLVKVGQVSFSSIVQCPDFPGAWMVIPQGMEHLVCGHALLLRLTGGQVERKLIPCDTLVQVLGRVCLDSEDVEALWEQALLEQSSM